MLSRKSLGRLVIANMPTSNLREELRPPFGYSKSQSQAKSKFGPSKTKSRLVRTSSCDVIKEIPWTLGDCQHVHQQPARGIAPPLRVFQIKKPSKIQIGTFQDQVTISVPD
jgi:hypothetical protein